MSSERQADNTASPWWGEHLHRYQFAAQYIQPNSTILDLACGEGFGTHYIHAHCHPQIIVGGDLSPEAIELCRKKYPGLQFEVMDGTRLNYPDNYFTSIISFETIEHTTQYREMLAEFKRVLKPGGTLYLSTPNININSPGGIVTNPFHTQEFTYQELKGIIDPLFTTVTIYGQQYARYKTRKGLGRGTAAVLESFFYLRLIRKTPLGVKNFLFKLLIGKDFYPAADDYNMVKDHQEVMNCKTFFVTCSKA